MVQFAYTQIIAFSIQLSKDQFPFLILNRTQLQQQYLVPRSASVCKLIKYPSLISSLTKISFRIQNLLAFSSNYGENNTSNISNKILHIRIMGSLFPSFIYIYIEFHSFSSILQFSIYCKDVSVSIHSHRILRARLRLSFFSNLHCIFSHVSSMLD